MCVQSSICVLTYGGTDNIPLIHQRRTVRGGIKIGDLYNILLTPALSPRDSGTQRTLAQRNPTLLFVLPAFQFRFVANTPAFEPLFQFPPRSKRIASDFIPLAKQCLYIQLLHEHVLIFATRKSIAEFRYDYLRNR